MKMTGLSSFVNYNPRVGTARRSCKAEGIEINRFPKVLELEPVRLLDQGNQSRGVEMDLLAAFSLCSTTIGTA